MIAGFPNALAMAWRKIRGASVRDRFAFDHRALPPDEALRRAFAADTTMAQLFYRHEGRTIHKLAHYPATYDREFARFRGSPVRMLEIGVSKGGSIELWRRYFGADSAIWGIDIDPACADRVDPPNEVRIGSQADPAFLASVVAEMGSPDIVLDDGSHVADHQRASFAALFPALSVGGLYVIEDLHTAYWPGEHRGGYRRRGTAIEFAKQLVDDMHGWYHDRGARIAAASSIASVRFYDSIVVIEKGDDPRPHHVKLG